jgi:hypothetical protein
VLVPGFPGREYVEGDALDLAHPMVFSVDGVLTDAECQALVREVDARGPTSAPITTGRGFVHRPDIRNNTRVMFDDVPLAARLFTRLGDCLPGPMCGGLLPVGLNERFRGYRYEPGQRFAPHYDGAFVRNPSEQSLLTFMVYLNQDFEGGTTDFLQYGVRVQPRTGRALLFQHFLLHEGTVLHRGVKYALRSDVMYRATAE